MKRKTTLGWSCLEELRAVIEQNPKEKKPLGRPRRRWEDVIKKDEGQMGGDANWRNLALNREG